MRSIIRISAIAGFWLLSSPLWAQTTGRATADQGDRGRTTAAPPSGGAATSSAAATASARPASTVSYGESARPSVSYGSTNSFSSGSSGTYSSGYPTVVLRGTSFYSYSTYYQWQNFLYNLDLLYGFSLDRYRFMRNSEPLLTPKLASLAVLRPLQVSAQLIMVVDELSSLLETARAGKEVDKKAIEASAQQIRKLAKSIRTDPSLTFIDQREDVDLTKGLDTEKLGLDAINQLREIALDLNSQLHSLSDQAKTSTVSVDYLTRPSFESLSKGIEKLSKVIQNSARRL